MNKYENIEYVGLPEDRLNEILREMDDEISKLDTIQLALKLIINSIYGAFGNSYFYFHNKDVAASITAQGQDLIKFSISVINHYFRNLWHTDYELHKILGIDSNSITPISQDSVIYVDTDSNYVNFKLLIDSVKGLKLEGKDAIDFCVSIIKHRFAKYLDTAFERYAESYNTKNQQEFKLENISDVGIFIAKKNYVLRPVYDGEAQLHIKPKLKPKGIDAAKPSFPKFLREKQEAIINEVLMRKGTAIVHERDLLPTMRSHKKAFAMLQLEDMCFNKNLKEYEKYVKDDSVIVIADKMPPGARAALYHNHLIEATNIRMYKKLHGSDKIKFYHAKDDRPGYEEMDIFAFSAENFPSEFAPCIDRDVQFNKAYIESINKFLCAMGLQEVTGDLKRDVVFVAPKKKNSTAEDAIYPFYAVNASNLQAVEIPSEVSRQFNPILGVEDPSDEYVKYISMFGIDTHIVPSCELADHLKKLEKVIDAKAIKKMNEDELLKAYGENLTLMENTQVSADNAKAAVDQMNLTIKAETAAKNKQAVAEYKIRLAEMKADHKELDKRLKLLKWYDEQYKKAAEKIREAKLKAAIESNDDDEDYDE